MAEGIEETESNSGTAVVAGDAKTSMLGAAIPCDIITTSAIGSLKREFDTYHHSIIGSAKTSASPTAIAAAALSMASPASSAPSSPPPMSPAQLSDNNNQQQTQRTTPLSHQQHSVHNLHQRHHDQPINLKSEVSLRILIVRIRKLLQSEVGMDGSSECSHWNKKKKNERKKRKAVINCRMLAMLHLPYGMINEYMAELMRKHNKRPIRLGHFRFVGITCWLHLHYAQCAYPWEMVIILLNWIFHRIIADWTDCGSLWTKSSTFWTIFDEKCQINRSLPDGKPFFFSHLLLACIEYRRSMSRRTSQNTQSICSNLICLMLTPGWSNSLGS